MAAASSQPWKPSIGAVKDPFIAVPFPSDPRFVIVSLIGVERGRRAAVALFSPVPLRPRFLPSLLELGQGLVEHAAVDDSGNTWLTLSWSGDLVRLEAR